MIWLLRFCVFVILCFWCWIPVIAILYHRHRGSNVARAIISISTVSTLCRANNINIYCFHIRYWFYDTTRGHPIYLEWEDMIYFFSIFTKAFLHFFFGRNLVETLGRKFSEILGVKYVWDGFYWPTISERKSNGAWRGKLILSNGKCWESFLRGGNFISKIF